MSMAEAVRAALDAYFASPPSPAGSAWRHPARGQDTGLGGDAGDRVAALRGAVPGLRRGSEIARPSDPQPETPPRPLSPKARQRVRATAQANDAMDTDQLVAVLGPLLPGEDRRAIRALVESLRDGA